MRSKGPWSGSEGSSSQPLPGIQASPIAREDRSVREQRDCAATSSSRSGTWPMERRWFRSKGGEAALGVGDV